MNVWLLGHGGFYNRGCEAIVRSTAQLIEQQFGPSRFTLFSYDKTNDVLALRGKPFQVIDTSLRDNPFYRYRGSGLLTRVFGHSVVTSLSRCFVRRPTCALSIGGDNFTLDYGVPKRFVFEGQILLDTKIPFVIWGASVGPFSADPKIEEEMVRFLRRVNLITVRESISLEYLKSLGIINNVVRVMDPAFALDTEKFIGPEANFVKDGDAIGLNISGLVVRWTPHRNLDLMLDDIASFIDTIINKFKVLLVPHVNKLNGPMVNNDEHVLQLLLGRLKHHHENIILASGRLSAQKIKWLISQCRIFIGARTHSTIAAMSTGVPTIAIGYSQKARGICVDVFENDDYLVSASSLTKNTLLDTWERLRHNEVNIRNLLKKKKPELIEGARRNAIALRALLTRSRFSSGCKGIEAISEEHRPVEGKL
jgi:colanic acid/amylovoran biosynthesis protein